MTLVEGDLSLDIPEPAEASRFEQDYGVSHCGMKAVDFIVEEPNRSLYLEFKDPGHPAARPVRGDYLGDSLMMDLAKKLRDSFLVQWARGKASKPIHYFVIVGVPSLKEPELAAATEKLRRLLPAPSVAPKDWRSFYVSNGAIFNIESWNRLFPMYRLSRLSEAENA